MAGDVIRQARPGDARRAEATGAAPLLRAPLVRVALALSVQTVVALGAGGGPGAWRAAASWWVAWLVPVDLATLGWLLLQLRREGRTYAGLFAGPSDPPRKDLPWYALAVVAGLPLGLVPNLLLGQALWGSAGAGAASIFRAMPMGVVWSLLALVPLCQGLSEPALYLGYVLPRLLRASPTRRRAVAACALLMAGQNLFFPLLLDWRFALWRALMFLPLSLWLAWLVARRPTLLPYLAVAHGAMNVSLPLLVLRLSMPVG